MLPTPGPGEPLAVANFNTFIYSGPGENYAVYGAFLGGRTALVIGKSEDGGWWAVSVPLAQGGAGWVDTNWVTVTNAGNVPVLPTPPLPPVAGLPAPGPDDPQVRTIVNTAVRSGPGDDYPAYGIAPAGRSAQVLGKSQDSQWWVIRIDPALVGAGYGWIAAAYVMAENTSGVPVVAAPAPPAPAPLPTPAPGSATATAVDYINLRSGPGLNYPVLVVAAPGATGEVSGRSADREWWQVKVPTDTVAAEGAAWVSADFVYVQNGENVAVVEAPPAPPVIDPEQPITVGACSLLSQTPEDKTVFAPNALFETSWTLQNTGNAAWEQDQYDIRFLGAFNGTILHLGSDVYDLPTTVNTGWNIPVTIPMVAPGEPGIYAEGWSISLGNQIICPFYVVIEVK
jgi:uncharacterized protein YraI